MECEGWTEVLRVEWSAMGWIEVLGVEWSARGGLKC